MSTNNDGGQAFPAPGLANLRNGQLIHPEVDMSLRDYFAAEALAAMIGKDNKDGANCGASGVDAVAGFAYEYADAMLLARTQAAQPDGVAS